MKFLISSLIVSFCVMAAISVQAIKHEPTKYQHRMNHWNDVQPNKSIRQIVIWNH